MCFYLLEAVVLLVAERFIRRTIFAFLMFNVLFKIVGNDLMSDIDRCEYLQNLLSVVGRDENSRTRVDVRSAHELE